jgi:hypothetical protein
VAEKRYAEGVRSFRRHGAKRGDLEDAAHRPDLGLAYLRDAVEDELDRLLVEGSDCQRSSGNPAVLIRGGELLREPLLDCDDQLVQRCSQHRGRKLPST